LLKKDCGCAKINLVDYTLNPKIFK